MQIENFDDELALGIAWLVKNTGFPSFDQYRKNPDKWRVRPEELFESADGSSLVLKDKVRSQKYMWKNEYTCDSLEQVERIAKDEGFSIGDLEMIPAKSSVTGTSQDGQFDIFIQFWPKDSVRAMGGVVAND